VTWVRKKDTVVFVAGYSSTEVFEYVFVTVVVEIGKRYAVAFLKMASSTRRTYLDERSPILITIKRFGIRAV
jgi:hypothetical protein